MRMRAQLWRRGRVVIMITAVAVLATGCVDVVQYISGTGSTIDVYLRLALQKSAFEIGNSFSDEPQDMDEMFEEDFELNRDEVLGELPEGITADYSQINNEFDYGFELSYSASRDTFAELEGEEGAFVPRVTARGMTIPLAEAGDGSGGGQSGEGDEFAAAFLGGAKYRVFISKRLVSRVSSARLANGSMSTDVTVIDLPDVWMIQFPISLWLMSDATPSLEISY